MPLHRRRDFDALPVIGLTVGNRSDQQLSSITDDLAGNNHHDRSILEALLLTLVCLIRPEIGVAEDVSRLGRLP